MASVGQSDEGNFSESESDVSEESDSEDFSDLEADCQVYTKVPCKYYNSGGCRDGGSCSYLHVCKYYLSGNCRYGSNCKLNHNKSGGRQSSGASSWALDESTSCGPKLTDGRYYQWQLNDGSGWKDVDNDHVLEAQYSLPHTKSIKIYNTPYGAVSVDFNRMRVQGKRLKVRRLDDGNTVWIWYCTLRRKWMKYGAKDSKGNPGPVNSSDIEKEFQSNPTSSFTFNVGAQTYEIRFREMRQVGKKKRKVTRRPEYRQQQQAAAGAFQAASVLQNLAVGSKPVWQFEGDSGRWHEFKDRRGNECTVTSDDMERKYQQNPRDSMIFTVKGHSYQLDFGVCYPHMMEDFEKVDCFQETPVSGKHYEWQLLVDRHWLPVANDHVIETHYCQPGAKGITINTSHGQVFIDFDKLQTPNAALKVQRLSFLSQGQTEDVGWYFRDDQLWCEYGAQGSGRLSSSISSRDIELQFSLNPQGTFRFTVGSTGYSLDFSAMTQMNHITGLCRNVRRRPKLTSNTESLSSTSILPTASSSQLTDGGYKWEFMGDEGVWTEYQAHICSFDSAAIERQYQMNPQGQLHFRVKSFSYTLDFSKMCQVNNIFGTSRTVRRTVNHGIQQSSSSSTSPRWQFQDIGGTWTDYSKGLAQCSISSQDIELQYQQNPSGTTTFTTEYFSYELNFSAMTQKNLSTTTTRRVRRLNQ